MLLGEILQAESVRLRLEAVTSHEAIRELLDVLIQAGEVPENLREHFIRLLTQREDKMSTGMEAGVALPHASSDHIRVPVAAIGISRKGIRYETLDGKPVQIVVLMLFPRRQFQGNVRTLASVASLLDQAEFRKGLLEIRRRDELAEFVRRSEEDLSLSRDGV